MTNPEPCLFGTRVRDNSEKTKVPLFVSIWAKTRGVFSVPIRQGFSKRGFSMNNDPHSPTFRCENVMSEEQRLDPHEGPISLRFDLRN